MGSAAALFHSANTEVETLNRRVRPSEGQREYLLEHKNELAAWLASDLDDLGMEVSHFIQGSYKFHTLIRPLKKGDEYDVDLGLYFKGKPHADVDPTVLREAVQRSLRRYSAENDEIESLDIIAMPLGQYQAEHGRAVDEYGVSLGSYPSDYLEVMQAALSLLVPDAA